MMRRASIAAIATGLAILTVFAGARWAIGRSTAARASWHPPAVATTTPLVDPTSAHPGPTATSPAEPATPTPARTTPAATAKPTRSPSTAAKKPTAAPLDLRRTTGSGKVALTFDDGPHPTWTPKVLDQLRKAKVHATFCLVGTQAKRYPDLVARIVREGHTLCNHTWNHEFDLGKLSEAKIRDNLRRTNAAILAAVPDAQIAYFRHPGGNWTARAVKVARQLGMESLHWAVDPQDWARPGAKVIKDRAVTKAKSGAIVLLHDGGGDRSQTLAVLPEIITTLKQRYGIALLE